MKKIFFVIIILLANNTVFCKSSSSNFLVQKDSLIQNKISTQVKITSFNATLNGGYVTCNWVTVQEINNNYFELERSFDGINFKTSVIAFGAEGNSNENINYQFKDKNETLRRNDVVYYRLKQIGNDSIVHLIKMIKISLSQNAVKELGVVPNPFATNFTYNLNAPSKGFVITKILNLGGRLMATKHTAVNKGINSLAIDELNGFSNGVYIMEVMMNGSVIGRQKINKG